MPTQVIPRPSTLYLHEPASAGDDVDLRLVAARFDADADIEDEAAGYAATPGLDAKIEQLEAEYLQTYGRKAPRSCTLVLIRRSERMKAAMSSNA